MDTVIPLRTATAVRPLVMSEVFGPTLQGEGPSAGRPAHFVRLGRCNLDCSWCDTPYTWDWRGKNGTVYDPAVELTAMTAEEVIAELDDPSMVVVTGGEPLLRGDLHDALLDLLLLAYPAITVEVETNATRPLPPYRYRVAYNLSPKLAHSGVDQAKAYRPEVWDAAAGRSDCRFKFVCATPGDVAEAAALCAHHGVLRDRVWIMPEGTTPEVVQAHTEAIADAVVGAGFNLSPRLHVTAWGDARGR